MTVSLSQAVFLPFFFALAVVAGCAVCYFLGARRRRRRAAREQMYRCAACGAVYVDARRVPMARCPQCGRYNQAVGK